MNGVATGPGNAANRFHISPARICAVAFTVFILTVAIGCYIDQCVLPRFYTATSEVEIVQPSESDSADPIRAEIEVMQSPDVLSPIVTDLQLDKIWAKRFYKSALDALPMEDAVAYLNSILQIRQVPNTHIVKIAVASVVPKEASDIANAVADRYKTLRDVMDDRGEKAFDTAVARQKRVVAEQSDAVETMRSQLRSQGIEVGPGMDGVIAAEIAAKQSGSKTKVDALVPLVAAQEELVVEQRVLDNYFVNRPNRPGPIPIHESPVEIIALAAPPEYPSFPNHSLNTLIAIAAGIPLAAIAATLTELAFWYVARISPPKAPPPDLFGTPAAPSAEY